MADRKSAIQIAEFGEWLINEAESRGFAMIAFVGAATVSGEKEIDFQSFQTALSIRNTDGIGKNITKKLRETIENNIMEEVKSTLDIHLSSPMAHLLDC
jgi:hypothetical protein